MEKKPILLITLMVLGTIVLSSWAMSVVTETEAGEDVDLYAGYKQVNKTYPVEAVIYGTAYDSSFTEVRYNDNGTIKSISDVRTDTVGHYRQNDIVIKRAESSESYLVEEYVNMRLYPNGYYTLYLGDGTPIGMVMTDSGEGDRRDGID